MREGGGKNIWTEARIFQIIKKKEEEERKLGKGTGFPLFSALPSFGHSLTLGSSQPASGSAHKLLPTAHRLPKMVSAS